MEEALTTKSEQHTWNSGMSNDRCFNLRILSILLAAALSLQLLSAQPKSVGATFSFTGPALNYEHSMKDSDSFIEVSLKAETAEYYLYRSNLPGISGNFTWNFPIKTWNLEEVGSINFIAGPGFACGFCKDYKLPDGFYFGIKGKIGFEWNCIRQITVSTFISPIIASHIESGKEYLMMKPYYNGLIYGLIPEVGVKYRF